MYIADYGNHRIQMWKYGASNGFTVAGTGVAGTSLTQLGSPTSVIVDKNGYMYITDEGNNRILRWQINSTFGVCIAACTGITGNKMNQLYAPVSLAFGNDGSMYVTDYFNNRVQKFQIVTNQSENSTII
jgi:sugar lactone lactonase YvrE